MAVYWTTADAIKLKNKIAQQPTPVAPTVVSWWPIATANALWSMQNANAWLQPKPTTVAPVAPVVPPKVEKPTVPVFWTPASQQNATDSTYLDTRNTDLAKQYGTQGLKTQDQVMQELLKNQDFAGATESDRQHTAEEIFKKMNVWQTGTTTQVKTDDLPTDTKQYWTIQEAEADNPRTQNLSAEEKQVYGMLSDMEKKQFLNIGRSDLQASLKYLARWKEARDFKTKQNTTQLKQTWLSNENADINSWQRIRQSEEQLNKLKANVKYLGTMWAPWVSATKMDAINGQITEAQKVFDELKTTEANAKKFRELWYTDISDRMEREMVLMQDDLDDKVNKSIQNAFSMMSAEEIKGWLDTVEEIDTFRKKLLTNLDNDIWALTDDNIKARTFLIERYETIAKEQKAYIENSNKVNTDMSTAKWYYVDGNGQAILDQQWSTIPMPQKPMYPPAFNDDKSMMITFDAKWNPSKPIQLFEASEEWTPTTITTTDEYGNEIKNTVLINKKWQTKPIWWWANPTWLDNPSIDTNDLSGNKVATQISTDPKNIANIAANMVEWQQYDCGTRWQCWERFNDATGKQKPVADSRDSKKKYIDYGITEWQAGMWVVFNPWWEYIKNWHVGMLASWLYSKNGVMWYDVVSANYDGNEKLSKDFIPEWTIAKNGWFIPLQATQSEQQQTTQQNKQQLPIDKQEMMMQAMWLLQGTGGTEWERAKMAQNIVQTAIKNNIPLNEAKKQLWYRTQEDNEFVKNTRADYETIKKWNDAVDNAKRLVSLLWQEQTPITDIASIVWFLKSIDPSSVARESETEQIRTARSMIDGMWVYAQQLANGKSLSKKQREEIKSTAQTIVNMWNNKLSTEIWWILQEFDERWLDATSVVRKTDIDKYAPVSYKIKNSKDQSITPVQINASMTQPTPSTWSNDQWDTNESDWWGRWNKAKK